MDWVQSEPGGQCRRGASHPLPEPEAASQGRSLCLDRKGVSCDRVASLGQLDDDTDIVRIAPPVLAGPPAPAPPLHEAALAPGTSSPPGTQPPRTRATGKAAGKTAEKTAGKAAGKKKPKK